MDRLKSFFKEVSSRWSYRYALQREGVSSSLVILLRVNIGARALTIDLTWNFLFCDHLAKYYKSLYGNTYDQPFLGIGIKNTVKFWIRNTSPHFHSASLRQCSHLVPGFYSTLGTNVNTPFFLVPTPEFGHGASARVQGPDLVLRH